jgi:hypothetical protein
LVRSRSQIFIVAVSTWPVHVVAFVVPGRHGAELLELVDAAFDSVALFVAFAVEGGRPAAVGAFLAAVGRLVGLDRDGHGDNPSA